MFHLQKTIKMLIRIIQPLGMKSKKKKEKQKVKKDMFPINCHVAPLISWNQIMLACEIDVLPLYKRSPYIVFI